MNRTFLFVASVLVGAGTFGTASASTFINFNSMVDADLTTFTGGSGYPGNGGVVTISGIDHQLALTSTNRTGAMFFINGSRDVDVNVFGVKEVYTLINSTVGVFGELNGTVEFFGANGAYQSLTLTQGDNIRDHYNGSFNNVAANLNGTLSYQTGVRFDQQKIVLDSSFHATELDFIRFTGVNNFGINGNPMLQSITVETVPEPGSLAAIAIGLAALRKRAKK